jgi:outer membrane protein
MPALLLHSLETSTVVWLSFFAVFLCASRGVCQQAPVSPDRPWHSSAEQDFMGEAKFPDNTISPVDSARTYSLSELIDLAETQNPETRVAWEQARAQAASLGIARSELFPALASTALASINRYEVFSGSSFDQQTMADFEGDLELNYTVFDFGARSGRIGAAKAEVLAANFAFNDTHRRVIYQVEQAYYQLLNASGQIEAAEASLTNALVVEQAVENRLSHGLATAPDVLEARSASAEADYELQAVRGTEDISRGNLARILGVSPIVLLRTQPLDQLVVPDSISETVERAFNRAFVQRPDLMQQLAEVRSANARVKEARAAYYPTLSLYASGGRQSLLYSQEGLPWKQTADWAGEAGLSLTWSLFDGGARKNSLKKAKADALAAEAKVNASRDLVTEEVWTAYSKLQIAFRERQSALALLTAADQSYTAALESYSHGVRNLLDVSAAQQTLAQARSADVQARTTVLSALAELAFQTGNSIQSTARRAGP